MAFLDLLVASSMPVLKVLILTSVGSLLATSRVNILGKDARKHLNNVVFYVFNPAFVSTNVAKTVTLKSLALLWFMPVNILIIYIIGCVLGWIVIQLTKTPPHLKGLIYGCCSAGIELKLDIGSYSLVWLLCFASYEVGLNRRYRYKSVYALIGISPNVKEDLSYDKLINIGAIFLWSFVYNVIRASTNCSQATGLTEETTKLLSHSQTCENVPEEESISGTVKHTFRELLSAINIKKILAPSTIGVMIGFIVGVIPQVRDSFIGSSAPLHVMLDSAALLGQGAIPSATLVMGGNLTKGLQGSDLRLPIIIGVMIVRYVVLPLSGIFIVKWAIRLGMVHSDPLYRFILLLQYSVPPAMNIGTITQLFGSGESECSVMLLWTYASASVSLTLWSTLFLHFVS